MPVALFTFVLAIKWVITRAYLNAISTVEDRSVMSIHSKEGVKYPLRFLSPVDFEYSFQKTKK